MSISTVVFDFGNVLGFFSHRQAAEQLASYTDAAPEAIRAYLFGCKLEADFESGKMSADVFRGLVRETFRLRCTDAQFDAAYSDMFSRNPDVCPLPALLKPRYRVLLLSNTNELHANQFLRQFAEVLAPFDARVLSYEVGIRKPDPHIYEHCRRLADRPASECLFIDDLPSNVEGAVACGWQGIVYRRGDDLRRELAAAGVVANPPTPFSGDPEGSAPPSAPLRVAAKRLRPRSTAPPAAAASRASAGRTSPHGRSPARRAASRPAFPHFCPPPTRNAAETCRRAD